MSELLTRTNLLGDALLAPLSAASAGSVLDRDGAVIAGTPAAAVATAVAVGAATIESDAEIGR